jgi:hypothetical protein
MFPSIPTSTYVRFARGFVRVALIRRVAAFTGALQAQAGHRHQQGLGGYRAGSFGRSLPGNPFGMSGATLPTRLAFSGFRSGF